MSSTSPIHDADPRTAWRAALLLAATTVAAGLVVAFGLWALFGPSPDRHLHRADPVAFRAAR